MVETIFGYIFGVIAILVIGCGLWQLEQGPHQIGGKRDENKEGQKRPPRHSKK